MGFQPQNTPKLRRFPRPPSRLGRGTPLPIPLLPRHLGHLDPRRLRLILLDAFSVSIQAKPASAPPQHFCSRTGPEQFMQL